MPFVTPMVPFAMPVAFVMFWSPWILAPQMAARGGDGGHSAT